MTLFGVAACFAGINPDYNPNWQANDAWTVRVSFLYVDGRPKNVDPSQYPTNMVFPYLFLFNYSWTNADYLYKVEGITNATATISMTPTTNSSCHARHWTLECETNELTLQKVRLHENRPDFDEISRNVYGLDTWPTEEMGAPAAVLDFPKIPVDSISTNRLLNIPSAPGRVVEQDTVFTSSNVTIVLTRTNVLDGLDHKVTLVWPKGAKWWKSAKEEMGTNLVLSAERLDP